MNIEDVVELNIPVDYKALDEMKYAWHPYHASKGIERYACSITSLDGTSTPGPNFEPLHIYNDQHGTKYDEMSFREETLYASPYAHLFDKFHVGRSHYLKLPRAGYFPWHRDTDPSSIRVIHTIKNCSPDKLVWILDDEPLQLRDNRWYVINTLKKHCLFAFDEATFAVFNIADNKYNHIQLHKHMVIK